MLGEYALRFMLYVAATYFCIATPRALHRMARASELSLDEIRKDTLEDMRER